MTIESRKIEFVQAFLKLQNDEVISQFESLLKKKSTLSKVQDSEFKPMSINEFHERIDQAESDFLNKRFKSTTELVKKFS